MSLKISSSCPLPCHIELSWNIKSSFVYPTLPLPTPLSSLANRDNDSWFKSYVYNLVCSMTRNKQYDDVRNILIHLLSTTMLMKPIQQAHELSRKLTDFIFFSLFNLIHFDIISCFKYLVSGWVQFIYLGTFANRFFFLKTTTTQQLLVEMEYEWALNSYKLLTLASKASSHLVEYNSCFNLITFREKFCVILFIGHKGGRSLKHNRPIKGGTA